MAGEYENPNDGLLLKIFGDSNGTDGTSDTGAEPGHINPGESGSDWENE